MAKEKFGRTKPHSTVGTIGQIDAYLLPDAKGYKARRRFLKGVTEDERQQVRDEVLSTTRSDFRAFADSLDELKEHGIVKVLGSESSIEGSLAERPGWLKLLKIL